MVPGAEMHDAAERLAYWPVRASQGCRPFLRADVCALCMQMSLKERVVIRNA